MQKKQPGLGVSTISTRTIVLLVLAMLGLTVMIVAFLGNYSSAFGIVR
jgi:hypothetical protein